MRLVATRDRLAAMLVIAALAAAVAGCSSRAPAKAGTCLSPSLPSAVGASPAAGAATASASPAPVTGPAPTGMEVIAAGARHLPTVAVPCFDGSGDVRLTAITRPTVISLWASWCQPCRAELPGVESFSKAAAARVDVIGVDTADTHAAGHSMITDLALSFPVLFDQDKRLANAVGNNALPVTLFVAPGGQIRAIYSGDALNATTLRDWTAQYLGVRVAA